MMRSRLPTPEEDSGWNSSNGGPALLNIPSVLMAEQRTDLANGRRFVDDHGGDVRYVPPWKLFLHYAGGRWIQDSGGCYVEALARSTIQRIWEEITDELPQCDVPTQRSLISFGNSSAKKQGRDGMLAFARSEDGIPIHHDCLDSNPWLFNVENCTIDLRTGEPREHRREDYLTKLAPVRFDAKADCPIWHSFIEEVLAGRSEVIQFLRRFFGYCLTGVVSEHVLPFLYGTGANGKSTAVETFLALLGRDYSMKAAPDLLMSKANDSHPTERADLFRMRLVACNEIDQGRRLNESLTKDLTGGDSIRARRMKENFWEFKPTHKLLLCGNHKPVVRGQDNGIWRRLKLVPFTVTIPPERQDPQLRDKLLAELPGILNWCIAGCLDWQAAGLGEPEAIAEATADYRTEQDVVGAFIAERCLQGSGCKVKASELRADYEKWCKENGEFPLGGRRFGEALTERGVERFNSGGTWYQGIEIVTDF